MKFEEALKRLEEIAQELESGKADLDEALKLYAEGTELIKQCSKAISDAEEAMKEVSANA